MANVANILIYTWSNITFQLIRSALNAMLKHAMFDMRFVTTCMTHIPLRNSSSKANVTQHCPAWTAAVPMTPWLCGNGVNPLAGSLRRTGFQRRHFSSLPSARETVLQSTPPSLL